MCDGGRRRSAALLTSTTVAHRRRTRRRRGSRRRPLFSARSRSSRPARGTTAKPRLPTKTGEAHDRLQRDRHAGRHRRCHRDAGKSHITVRVVGNYLNLMQIDPYGALYVTTVFNAESKNGRLRAVHTRHEYLPTRCAA